MQHIVIANSKGGSGKTMLVTQLASYYASQGKSVAIFDHDSQRSSIDWVKARPNQYPAIDYVSAYSGEDLKQRTSIAIHDMPAGYDIRDLQADVPLASKLLIPLLPSPTDLRAVWRFCMLLSYTGLLDCSMNVGFVINRYRAASAFNETMMSFLNRLDAPVVGRIRDTQNYIHACNQGLGIFDLPPRRSIVDRESWHPIIQWIEHNNDELLRHEFLGEYTDRRYLHA